MSELFKKRLCREYIIHVLVLHQEGNLKRYPTPYPEELKNMVKTAQSVAHRLKEDESDGTRPTERNHIGVQDVGVKVSLS